MVRPDMPGSGQNALISLDPRLNALILLDPSLNYQDYDGWRDDFGLTDWGWENVLPYFIKVKIFRKLSKFHSTITQFGAYLALILVD